MGFCSCTLKYLLVIFNLACAVAGIIILVVGILSNNEGGNFKQLFQQISTASICLMVLGAIVFLIAFFGCCGALREDTCMIQTYGVILLIILIAEIAIAITAFVYKGKVGDALKEEGTNFFNDYAKNKKAIDDIQKELDCCGFEKPYTSPSSFGCCPKGNDKCSTTPCKDQILAKGKSILNTIGGVAIGIGVVELIGVICAFYVASSIRQQMRRGYA